MRAAEMEDKEAARRNVWERAEGGDTPATNQRGLGVYALGLTQAARAANARRGGSAARR